MEQHRGNDSGSHGWVTTRVAAASLGIKSRQCRNLIQEGELEAKLEGEGRKKRYLVSVASLEALRDKRQSERKLPLIADSMPEMRMFRQKWGNGFENLPQDWKPALPRMWSSEPGWS
jgi:hypothetical protein